MVKRNSLLVLTMILVGAPFAAQAQPPGPVAFDGLDLDGDGYVTASEFSAHRDARMQSRLREGRLLRNASQAPTIERWDANEDGVLSRAEVAAGQQTRFAARGFGGRRCWRYAR